MVRVKLLEQNALKEENEGVGLLLQFHERVVGADRIGGLHQDLFDHSIATGADALFHFHGLNHTEFLAVCHLFAGAD